MNPGRKITLWVVGGLGLLVVLALLLFVRWVNQFEYEQITPDLHIVYTNIGGNVAVLRTGEGAVIVDTMTFSMQGETIRSLAEELTGEKVAVVVNTHWHFDHTHGNPAFGPGVRVVSTDNTKHWLETLDADYWQGSAAEGLPNETFVRSHLIELGDKSIELHWTGRGHTNGDLVALFREDETIHMGDLFFHRLYPFVDLDTGGSVQAWGDTLRAVLDLGFEHVIPGHGPLTDRAGLLEFKAMMEDLAHFARDAAEAEWSLEDALAKGTLHADENFKPLRIGPITMIDREALMGFAWRETQQCSPLQGLSALAHADKASPSITAEYLQSVVAEISHDDYGGRGPGSDGDLQARQWLAAQFTAMGVAPGTEDGYQQAFELVGVTSRVEGDWAFSNGFTGGLSSELIVNAGNQSESASFEDAELVFVGYGIQAPEYQWDDFKGVDVRGKVLVMLNNDPDWDPNLFAGERRLYYGRWTYKYEIAAELGAAAAIIIHTTPSAGYPWQVVETSWSGPQFELPAAGEPRLQASAWMTEGAARRLLASSGQNLDALVKAARSREFAPVPLGVTSSLTLSAELERVETANVLAQIDGCDPELKSEAIIITAHHDHLGMGEATQADEDVIYNGALDNATGVAGVLAIAKALKAMPTPPRRSIVFALVGAEEQGLLGSAHYARHPTFHPGKIAANVNLDGANIWGEASDMIFVGLGKSSLDNLAREVADYTGRSLHGDQFPDRGYYYRSDQFSFAKVGVPGMYLDGGVEIIGKPEGWGRERIGEWTEQHYHQPSDELTDEWVFDGMVADMRFALLATYLIAQADEMPAWNAGDEFEAARNQALEALQSLENTAQSTPVNPVTPVN